MILLHFAHEHYFVTVMHVVKHVLCENVYFSAIRVNNIDAHSIANSLMNESGLWVRTTFELRPNLRTQ